MVIKFDHMINLVLLLIIKAKYGNLMAKKGETFGDEYLLEVNKSRMYKIIFTDYLFNEI